MGEELLRYINLVAFCSEASLLSQNFRPSLEICYSIEHGALFMLRISGYLYVFTKICNDETTL